METVIIFGETGAGKSTIANLLLQGEVFYTNKFENGEVKKVPDNYKKPLMTWSEKPTFIEEGKNMFPIGDGIKATTLECKIKENKRWKIYDTPGVLNGDSINLTDPKVARKIKNFLDSTQEKFDYILIVKTVRGPEIIKDGMTDDEAYTNADAAILCSVASMFGGATQNCVLVFTKAITVSDTEKDLFVRQYSELLATPGVVMKVSEAMLNYKKTEQHFSTQRLLTSLKVHKPNESAMPVTCRGRKTSELTNEIMQRLVTIIQIGGEHISILAWLKRIIIKLTPVI